MSDSKGHFSFRKYSFFDFLIIFVILFGIFSSAFFAFDPVERKNKQRDEAYMNDAKNVVTAIQKYKEKENFYPWVSSKFTKNNSEFLAYQSFKKEGLGLCGKDCTEKNEGLLVSKSYLAPFYLEKNFTDGSSINDLKIGKENGATSKVYACFIPLSKFAKEKAAFEGNAWVLNENGTKVLGKTSSNEVCDPNSTWTSCYVCTP